MGWIDQKPYIHPHISCRKPYSNGNKFGVGSVWQCDNCKRRWRFTGTKYVSGGHQLDSGYEDSWELIGQAPDLHTGPGGYGVGMYDR